MAFSRDLVLAFIPHTTFPTLPSNYSIIVAVGISYLESYYSSQGSWLVEINDYFLLQENV